MDLRLLNYFITVVEKKTFTEAAQTLRISQPSLSVAIKTLEERLDLTLLNRTTRTVNLTTKGKIIYKKAKKIVTHYDYFTDEVERLRLEGPLELSIGFIDSSKFWLPEVLGIFQNEFADIHIKLSEILSLYDIEKALTSYDVDIAITNQYMTNDDLEVIPIYEENLVVVLPPNHHLKSKAKIEINDLVEEKFIQYKTGLQTRKDILNIFRKSGIKPNVAYEIERFETACILVENNLGITIIPENYVNIYNNPTFYIREINKPYITRTVYIAYNKTKFIKPHSMRFINIIHEYFNNRKKE